MVVETGTGLTNSNSYVDIDFADDYFSTRGIVAWSNLTVEKKQIFLIKATDYIDNAFKYKGLKGSAEQSLNFPRKNLIDESGYVVKGIPLRLKMAVCECALVLSNGTELFHTENENGAVTSEKIGELSFTYDVAKKIKDSSIYESVNTRLRGLYEDTSIPKILSGNVRRV